MGTTLPTTYQELFKAPAISLIQELTTKQEYSDSLCYTILEIKHLMEAEKAVVKEEKCFQANKDFWPVDKAINSISSCFVRFISSKSDFFSVRNTKTAYYATNV